MGSEVSEQAALIKQLQEQVRLLQAKVDGARKNHKFGVTNPLEFPPSLYNRELVLINQPFLSIRRKRLSCDKVRGRRIRDDVLQHALNRALLPPMVAMSPVCKSKEKELSLRPWHSSLFEGYRSVTKLSPESIRRLHRLEADAAGSEDDSDMDSDCLYEEEGDAPSPDCQEDLRVDPLTTEKEDYDAENEESEESEEGSTSSASSRKSMELENEKNRKDFCVKVLDTRVYRLKEDEDPWVTVLVVECKEPLNENGLWQAVAYAIREGFINLNKGRIAPIHVMQWSSGSWCYGVVDVYGAVRIENGVISDDSYEEFESHQKVRWTNMGKKAEEYTVDQDFSRESLESRLQERREKMRKNCSSAKEIDYPNGSYLVGNVYADQKRCDLPNATNVGRIGNPDSRRFYAALLKIIVGRKAERWTVEDLDAVMQKREAELKRVVEAVSPFTGKRKRVVEAVNPVTGNGRE